MVEPDAWELAARIVEAHANGDAEHDSELRQIAAAIRDRATDD